MHMPSEDGHHLIVRANSDIIDLYQASPPPIALQERKAQKA